MIVIMRRSANREMVRNVCRELQAIGLKTKPIKGTSRVTIEVSGGEMPFDPEGILSRPGVEDIVRVDKPYRLVSRETSPGDTVVQVGDVAVGGRDLVVMAGPCSVESRDQCRTIAEKVARLGVKIFRAGAFKPRTSPYSFQGLGEAGLEILAGIREEFGLLLVTEAIDTDTIDLVAGYTDIIQIGSRNMQNFSLLKKAGRRNQPILLKRGMSATIEEFLMAAEYVLAEGNTNVILCERGVRTFADHTRNTLDLSAVPAVKQISHLPIIVDPSHGTGRRNQVVPMSRAAIAAGADGLLIEVHHDPVRALSDGAQSISPEMFNQLMQDVRGIGALLDRTIA